MKFDIYKFLYESILTEQEPEQQQDQSQQAQQSQAQQQTEPQEPVPAEQSKKIKSISSPFDIFQGKTIKNISFKPSSGGGNLEIYFANEPLPLRVSWSGDKTTAQFKEIIALT